MSRVWVELVIHWTFILHTNNHTIVKNHPIHSVSPKRYHGLFTLFIICDIFSMLSKEKSVISIVRMVHRAIDEQFEVIKLQQQVWAWCRRDYVSSAVKEMKRCKNCIIIPASRQTDMLIQFIVLNNKRQKVSLYCRHFDG